MCIRDRCLYEIPGEVDTQRLGAASGAREDIHEHAPVLGSQLSLLGELALRGGKGVLAREVEQPCRRLDLLEPDGVPVLRDDGHTGVVIHGDDRDGTGMLEVLAHHRMPCLLYTSDAADDLT